MAKSNIYSSTCPTLPRLLLLALLGALPLLAGNNQSKPVPPRPERVEVRKGGRLVVTVGGHLLRPRADLRGLDLKEADLRWVDLRGADLRRADLTRAKLCGADLSGARLAEATLTGADLRDAILVGATSFGAVGAEFREAHLHPFFSEERPERLGAVRLLDLDRLGPRGAMHSLVAGPTGNLYWLQGDQNQFSHLSQTGALFAATPQVSEVMRGRQLAMAADARHHLLLLSERWFTFIDLEASEGRKQLAPGVSPYRSTTNKVTGARDAPLALFQNSRGALSLASPAIGTCRTQGQLRRTRTFLVVTKAFREHSYGLPLQGVVTAYPIRPDY